MKRRMSYIYRRLLVLAGVAYLCAELALLTIGAICWNGKSRLLVFLLAGVFAVGGVLAYLFLVKRPYCQTNRAMRLYLSGYSIDAVCGMRYPMDELTATVMDQLIDQLRRLELEGAATKQAEYLALQNQINPHFLYNTLDSIRSEALIVGMDELADMIERLSTFFRYCISNVNAMVTVEDELSNVNNYFQIQKFRFGEKMNLTIEMDPSDEKRISRCRLPKMTLQPIVENAVFHGLEPLTERGLVRIRVEFTQEMLLITVSDNGVGMSTEMVERFNRSMHMAVSEIDTKDRGKPGGIALLNVCRRIKLLFGESYGLRVYSIPNAGTDVIITLPCRSEVDHP